MERIKPVTRKSSKFIPNDLNVEPPAFIKVTSKWDILINENYLSLIEEEEKNQIAIQEAISKLILLIMMWEIFIFHSLIILQFEDETEEDLYNWNKFKAAKMERGLGNDFFLTIIDFNWCIQQLERFYPQELELTPAEFQLHGKRFGRRCALVLLP